MTDIVKRLRMYASESDRLEGKGKRELLLPYSRDTITKECQEKFGIPARDVHLILQWLYETHKLISYPSTDTQHLPVSLLADVPFTLEPLKACFSVPENYRDRLHMLSPAWNNGRCYDHYGIIPTTYFSKERYLALSPEEAKVFQLIAERYILQFHPSQLRINVLGVDLVADLLEAADTIEVLRADAIKEGRGFCRFLRRNARDLVGRLAKPTTGEKVRELVR